MPSQDVNGDIVAIADALLSYLSELESYRKVCRRHWRTVTVSESKGGLRVCRRLLSAEHGKASLLSQIEGLPGWEATPFWASERIHWEHHLLKRQTELRNQAGLQPIIVRGIGWNGRAMLSSAFVSVADAALLVELLLPSLPTDLPELPLRKIALALWCHEYALPASIATPAPSHPQPGDESLSIEEYLQRTMPQNLVASQCFLHGGAEK